MIDRRTLLKAGLAAVPLAASPDAPAQAPALLATWRALPGGGRAAIIGQVEAGRARVVLRTALGGERILDELEDDPLPRIC